MEGNQKLNEVFNEYLRTATFPVAIKVSGEEELPPRVRAASALYGYPINICQGITIARRFGRTIGFQEKDHACGLSILIFGFKEDPDFALQGHTIYPLYAKTPEAGARTQAATAKMEIGAIKSMVVAPLHRADFAPDLVLIYGNGAQIVRLIQAANYHEGGAIESQFMGRCSCAVYIVKTLQTQKCNVVIPGGGERVFALTADDEIAFAIPASQLQNVTEGLIGTHKSGVARIPTPFFGASARPVFPPSYEELDQYCGLK
ncbi:MAG: DUF169 domain-containing protein [Syntrophomonadaceae bacterium]|nr:DUF169 domain-containing protein [Syntrophomonadaceae bacterium]